MYLLKLYDIPIIMLLKNNITNFCSEISKVELFYDEFTLAMLNA